MSDHDQVVQPAEQEPPAGNDAAVPTAGVIEMPDLASQLALVAAERDQLAAEKAQLYDRLLRRQAEFENFRKRVERERSDMVEFAVIESVRALLPMLDDFERALKVESADREYAKGMELIYQRFLETFKKLGLEPIESAGQKFDFNLHHAVERLPSEGVEEETVVEELQRGYNYKGRLLRPAMVRVAVKP
jgi:molecular chaperone GrpE